AVIPWSSSGRHLESIKSIKGRRGPAVELLAIMHNQVNRPPARFGQRLRPYLTHGHQAGGYRIGMRTIGQDHRYRGQPVARRPAADRIHGMTERRALDKTEIA